MAVASADAKLCTEAVLAHLPQDGWQERWDTLCQPVARRRGGITVVRKIFLLQGFLILFVSLLLQLSAVSGPASKPFASFHRDGIGCLPCQCRLRSGQDSSAAGTQSDSANLRVHHGTRPVFSGRSTPQKYFGEVCVWWGLWFNHD